MPKAGRTNMYRALKQVTYKTEETLNTYQGKDNQQTVTDNTNAGIIKDF